LLESVALVARKRQFGAADILFGMVVDGPTHYRLYNLWLLKHSPNALPNVTVHLYNT
jgi:hypothetical protein